MIGIWSIEFVWLPRDASSHCWGFTANCTEICTVQKTLSCPAGSRDSIQAKTKTHKDWFVSTKDRDDWGKRDKEAWRHTSLMTTVKPTSTWMMMMMMMMTTTSKTTSTSTSHASTLPIPCSLWLSSHPVAACGQRWSVVPHKDRPHQLGGHANGWKDAEGCLYIHKDGKMIWLGIVYIYVIITYNHITYYHKSYTYVIRTVRERRGEWTGVSVNIPSQPPCSTSQDPENNSERSGQRLRDIFFLKWK